MSEHAFKAGAQQRQGGSVSLCVCQRRLQAATAAKECLAMGKGVPGYRQAKHSSQTATLAGVSQQRTLRRWGHLLPALAGA